MFCIATFKLDSTAIKFISCEELPCRLFDKGTTIIELDELDNSSMVASNQKILLNNKKVYFSSVSPKDIIVYQMSVFVLINKSDYNDTSCFTGYVLYKNLPAALFSAPKRVYDSFFKEIIELVFSNSKLEQIIINCNAVLYMDGSAIAAMIELIDRVNSCHCRLLFYSPSEKFVSYLKLSNIRRMTHLVEKNKTIDAVIKSALYVDSHMQFVLENSKNSYPVWHNRVNYVGRIDSLCNIMLQTPLVSRLHSAIFILNHHIYLIDCGSTNGTYINNKKLTPFTLHTLKVSDTILFGSSTPFRLLRNTDMPFGP